jgi:uncharacterized protein YigE (DUF2233 family)
MMLIPVAWRLAVLAFGLSFAPGYAQADPCRSETFEGTGYTVCAFDPAAADLRIFWRDDAGAPFRTFEALSEDMARRGSTLQFAMNGGMYGDDFSPTGLLVAGGEELKRANVAEVRGAPGSIPNFYKKPNGVFYLGPGGAGVMETKAFLDARPDVEFATQSGPMLVIDGELHPAFIAGSSDRKMRNGVGVSGPGEVHFVISEGRVNFHDFARFFREKLGCEDALFLDGGSAPGLYAPELGRDDAPGHGGYGPIIAVVGE